MTQNKNLPKNEIDELLSIIVAYKKIIISTTIIITLLATIYVFFLQKPIYQATALVQLGKTNTHVVEDENTLKQKLIATYKIYTDPNQTLPHIAEVNRPKHSKYLISLRAVAHSKDELSKLLNQEIETIKIEHNLSIAPYIKNQKERLENTKDVIKSTQASIKQLTTDNKELEEKLKNLNNDELALISLYSVTQMKNQTEISQLEVKLTSKKKYLTSIKRTLQPSRTFNTHIVDEIDMHPKPITPSRGVIMIVGFVSGVLLGILLAFFMSFVSSRRD